MRLTAILALQCFCAAARLLQLEKRAPLTPGALVEGDMFAAAIAGYVQITRSDGLSELAADRLHPPACWP